LNNPITFIDVDVEGFRQFWKGGSKNSYGVEDCVRWMDDDGR